MSIRKERPSDDEQEDWKREFHSLLGALTTKAIDRRAFSARVGALLAIAAAVPLPARSDPNTSNGAPADPWPTMAVVHDHLFPTTAGAPGAKEINATNYLRTVLAEPDMDPDDREFIVNGISWLNGVAIERHKLTFIELAKDERESVLRQIEKTGPGERWISLLLLYVFEALLSDPVYGGNVDQAGWRWLEHQPGFPRPPADYTYQKL